MRNNQAPWDEFDVNGYLTHNYHSLRSDDAQIATKLAFLVKTLPREIVVGDIGTGPNLYPSLFLATVAKSISLIDKSQANVNYINEILQRLHPPAQWFPFVEHVGICNNWEEYELLWKRLREITKASYGDIFDLPSGQWDFATMFFVAESITDQLDEFQLALKFYLESIRSSGSFFATFMEESIGYTVGDVMYPAIPIHIEDIRIIANRYCSAPSFYRIPLTETPVRTGYSGMIILSGRRDK